MTTCHGCNQPLEPLAQIRTYHTGCDPQGRVAMLERVIRAFLDEWDNPADTINRPGPHYSMTMAAISPERISLMRSALACTPAQMKGRVG